MRRVIVVGGGAAGLIAAWRSAECGAQVTLLEKTERLGTKILISGGGKCNITHDGPIEDVLRAFRPNEARFLRPSCHRFTNTQVLELLTSEGLEVYTRPDGRVFPVAGTSKDVVERFVRHVRRSGVEVRLETPVLGLWVESGRVTGVRVPQGELRADAVILATGGSSYPKSGTTGDGWPWAREVGHRVVPVRAALAPIETEPAWPERAGVALRDCRLKARQGGKEFARWDGDLLFTHRGVSGPTVLGISREVAERMLLGEVGLEVDLLPEETFETLTARLRRGAATDRKRATEALVHGMLPQRLVAPLLADAGLSPEEPIERLDKKGLNRLVAMLKGWSLGRARHVPLDKGEVVAGGVDLDEVDPRTMASRIAPGLYLCGEVLDIAGPVGGYNLQAAFATGFVAGESAASSR